MQAIPTAEERPTLLLEELCEPLHLGRSAIYRAAKLGHIPTIRVGHRLRVPTAALRLLLQLDEPAAAEGGPDEAG